MSEPTTYPNSFQFTLPDQEHKSEISPDQELIQIANVCKMASKQMDIYKAMWLIKVGALYARIHTKNRNFRIFNDIPEFTHSNLDAAIALSKIPNIDKIYDFGWKKLLYLYINSTGIQYSKISLETIEKEFGDLSEEAVEKGIMMNVLKSYKFTSEKINELWNNGLRLEMLRDKGNIAKIQNSKNITQTINGIIHRYEIKSKPVVKDDFDIYYKSILQGIKTKKMMVKTGKYDYIIDKETVINDLEASYKLTIRLLPIFIQEQKEFDNFIDKLINEMQVTNANLSVRA